MRQGKGQPGVIAAETQLQPSCAGPQVHGCAVGQAQEATEEFTGLDGSVDV